MPHIFGRVPHFSFTARHNTTDVTADDEKGAHKSPAEAGLESRYCGENMGEIT